MAGWPSNGLADLIGWSADLTFNLCHFLGPYTMAFRHWIQLGLVPTSVYGTLVAPFGDQNEGWVILGECKAFWLLLSARRHVNLAVAITFTSRVQIK